MALMACLLGYGEVGLWLKRNSMLPDTWVKLEGNPYTHWMEEYGGELYQGAVQAGLGTSAIPELKLQHAHDAEYVIVETLEACISSDPPSIVRFNEWKSVWDRCTKLEKGFWDMAMELRD